jgi:membrane protein
MEIRRKTLKDAWRILKKSFSSFMKEDAFTYSASISFYTMLSLPAVLLIVISVAATLYNENRIEQELVNQISSLIGSNSAAQIEEILEQAAIKEDTTLWAKIAGIAALIVSSTSVFISLQLAINKIWDIEAKPEKAFFKFIINRLLSLAMVIGIGFILMVALVIESLIVIFQDLLEHFNDGVSSLLITVGSEVISFAITMLIFTMMYKVLPDAKIKWKDVWVGGLITTALFVLGKAIIGIYLGASSMTSVYGASGSLVILLVWTYYAALIFLFGAKITHVYTLETGGKIETLETAVQVETVKIEKSS